MALLEICVDSVDGIKIAADNGADRIELCSALAVGGLSPSLSLLTTAQKIGIPVNVMVRPRSGSFLYSDAEIKGMIEEINQVREMKLAGVVFGVGSHNGLDFVNIKKLCCAAKGLDISIHRVVDLLPDRLSILPKLARLGVKRILTSGGFINAYDGISDISKLIEQSPSGLSIMPGSGITPHNIHQILVETGASEVHASAASIRNMSSHQKSVELGFELPTTRWIDGHKVAEMNEICRLLT